jgi:1-acyl-sn-glycerol-3-phosphate acyltransferase
MPHEQLAIVFLTAVALAPAVQALRWRRRHRTHRPMQVLWLFVMHCLARLLWRATVPPFPLTPGQGAVIVCNHRSSIDPFFLQLTAGRTIHWMVAREYCEHPAFGWYLRLAEVIPVNRGGLDAAATRAAIRLAASGQWVGMFPEGRINTTDQFMLPGRPGAVLVALKARAPILPCYIAGSPYGGKAWSPLFMRAKVTVQFGEPIDLSAYYESQPDAEQVGKLLVQALQAIARLAGREDFVPTVAGRRWKPVEPELA